MACTLSCAYFAMGFYSIKSYRVKLAAVVDKFLGGDRRLVTACMKRDKAVETRGVFYKLVGSLVCAEALADDDHIIKKAFASFTDIYHGTAPLYSVAFAYIIQHS